MLDPRRALAVTLTVAFLGLALPYGIPLFTPLAVYTLFCLLVRGSLAVPWNRGVGWFLASVVFLLAGALLSSRIEGEVVGDLTNAFSVLLLLPALAHLRRGGGLESFLDRLWLYLAVALGLASLVGLAKFALLLQGAQLPFVPDVEGRYPWGSALTTDYNFFAFGMLTGTVAALAVRRRSPRRLARIVMEAIVVTTVLAGALAGSRRYWAVAFMTGSILLVWGTVRGLQRFSEWWLEPRIAPPPSWVLIGLVLLAAGGYWILAQGVAIAAGTEVLLLRIETLATPTESLAPRGRRWSYAREILQSSSPLELLVGQGFDYLVWYADRFVPDQVHDYPHNPVLAAFLYSGAAGAVAVVGFLCDAIVQHVRQWRRFPYLTILFLGALIFVLPSLNSLFSAKFLPVLLLLPWWMSSELQALHPTVDG